MAKHGAVTGAPLWSLSELASGLGVLFSTFVMHFLFRVLVRDSHEGPHGGTTQYGGNSGEKL